MSEEVWDSKGILRYDAWHNIRKYKQQKKKSNEKETEDVWYSSHVFLNSKCINYILINTVVFVKFHTHIDTSFHYSNNIYSAIEYYNIVIHPLI